MGLIEFDIEKGTHVVSAKFAETPLRLVSDFITLTSAAILFVFLIKRNTV
jgi:hypothetical protein